MYPELSIVVATRNDDHGGELIKRNSHFLKGLIAQANKYKLPVELIIVEWNPPDSKPLLKDVLPAPQPGDYLELRYIVVPSSVHRSYRHGDTLGLFQMIAKNVGIRRAKAEYILCTNIDILFSDACFSFLAAKKLEPGKYYRNSRLDVPKEVMDFETLDEQLKFCQSNIIKISGGDKHYKYVRNVPGFVAMFRRPMLLLDKIWEAFEHGLLGNNRDLFNVDTEACGDFTLMSKTDWLKIEGYPELDLYSIHIDSMALMAARSLGIQQVLLKPGECIYHIEHKEGWSSFETPLDVIRFMEKRPGLDWHFVFESAKYINQKKTGWGLNKPDWGFAESNFEEFTMNAFQ
ncbi:MAG TPA: hypothetical protein VG603_13385 [Chitinophagales bacterium]|nr:hypothetical protein [Chitinophagales bacterium]